MITRWLLAMVAVLGLGACEGDGPTRPENLIGTWEARIEGAAGHREQHRLEITPTTYTWTQESYTPAGRPEDGLTDRFTASGEWEVRGDRLAMRAGSMRHWTHPEGEWIVDFVIQWDETSEIASLQGDRLTIAHRPRPEQSYLRPTLYFERVR